MPPTTLPIAPPPAPGKLAPQRHLLGRRSNQFLDFLRDDGGALRKYPHLSRLHGAQLGYKRRTLLGLAPGIGNTAPHFVVAGLLHRLL